MITHVVYAVREVILRHSRGWHVLECVFELYRQAGRKLINVYVENSCSC